MHKHNYPVYESGMFYARKSAQAVLSPQEIKLNRGDNDASADANVPVCHLMSKALNFGSVPFKNLKQYFGAAVLPLQPLPDQKGCLRYVALLEATSVADMKVDEVAADHGHDFVPLAGELSRLGDFAEASISGVRSSVVINMPRSV